MDNIVSRTADNVVKAHSDEDGVTGGYFDKDGVWHDFGGGGGDSITPILTATFSIDIPEGYEAFLGTNCTFVKDGKYFVYDSTPTLYDGDSADIIAPYIEDVGSMIDKTSIATIIGSPYNYTFEPSNMVNCSEIEDDGDKYIVITDPTKNASVTMTSTQVVN